MNEIQVRAWTGKQMITKDYNDDYYILTIREGKVILLEASLDTYGGYSPAPAKFMLYTTIPDKDEQMICEGDIIPDENGCILIVEYDEEKAAFILQLYGTDTYTGENGQDCNDNFCLLDTLSFDDITEISKWAKVIGNKYENPELVKGEKLNG